MTHPVHQQLLRGDDAFATTLVAIAVDHFGTEITTWTPATIVAEVETDFNVLMSHAAVDRLMAGVQLLTSNTFYTQVPDFNDLCNVLAWEPVTPGVLVPTDAASAAWGITEAMMLAPPDDMENAFSDQVKAFIGALVKEEGILNPPDVLRLAKVDKDLVSRVNYDYSDDPEMFGAINKVEEGKTNDINNFIKNRLRGLVMQLSSLRLKNGNVENIAEKMLANLEMEEQTASSM